VASQYVVQSGRAAMPASAADAIGAFDLCFGPAARMGVTLDQVRYGPRGPSVWFGTAMANLPHGRARVTVALVRIGGRIVAVQNAGAGAYESAAVF
jgi:hypothetical protein